jgi:hypothetical protein
VPVVRTAAPPLVNGERLTWRPATTARPVVVPAPPPPRRIEPCARAPRTVLVATTPRRPLAVVGTPRATRSLTVPPVAGYFRPQTSTERRVLTPTCLTGT